jgi:hypothetical protein
MFYVPMKQFQENLTFCWIYVKMIKFGTKISLFVMRFFCLFCIGHEKYPFFMKLCMST